MTDRIKNLKTTAIGLVVLALAVFLIATGKIEVTAFITLIVLGWIFLTAKDSLLEGITAGLFKIPTPEGSAKINQGAETVEQGMEQITQGVKEVNQSVQDAKDTPQP